MVVIHLARSGKKGDPIFKITVAEKGAKLTGRFIEKLGIYNPGKGKEEVTVNMDRYNHWLKVGAQPSPRLKKILATHTASAPKS